MIKPLEERFWSKVEKTDDCWNWIAAKNNGYGMIGVGKGSKLRYAHRLSWEMHHGSPAPSSLNVCHSCDNPSCVRPDHLWLGSQQDNLRDMREKGRSRWQ